jgi:hypothetical protein
MTHEELVDFTLNRSDLPLLTIEDKIVASIMMDISDRRRIKHEFQSIDDDILEEIHEQWRAMIRILLPV